MGKFESGNVVHAVNVVSAGSGFTVRPTIAIAAAPAGGVNAVATAVGKVVNTAIGVIGSAYVVGNILTVANGVGTAATLRVANVNGNGALTNVVIVNAGAYTTLPGLANNLVTGGNGTSGAITLTIGVGYVSVTTPGDDYSSTPAVTVGGAGGTGANAIAVMDEGYPYYVASSRTAYVSGSRTFSRTANEKVVAHKVWGEV